jgi:chaperonin GroEL (HSP60 family)
MLQKGLHPTIIAEAFMKACTKAVEYLTEISIPVDLNDRPSLLRAASTSLNSKVSTLRRLIEVLAKCVLQPDRLSVLLNIGSHCGCCGAPYSNAHIF